MAATGDDFGEVYTGQAVPGAVGTEDSEDPYSFSGVAKAEGAGAPAATGEVLAYCSCCNLLINKYLENEDDIYGFTENG